MKHINTFYFPDQGNIVLSCLDDLGLYPGDIFRTSYNGFCYICFVLSNDIRDAKPPYAERSGWQKFSFSQGKILLDQGGIKNYIFKSARRSK